MPIKLGTTNISTIYKGNTKIVRVYKGNNIVFQSGLPSEYQQVEYIQSDGNCYIDIQLEGKNGYTFETKVNFVSFPNAYTYLAGFGNSSSNRIYFTRAQNTAMTDGYTFTNAINLTSTNISANTDYVYRSIMKTGEQKLYRNNVLLGSGSLTNTNTYGTIWIFTSNYNGGSNGSATCKMYYAKFYYNDIIVRDLVPCYRKADNEIGMFDLVNGVFYTNAGTGTFTKGGNV